MPVSGIGLELPSSWLRKRKVNRGGAFALLRTSPRFGYGNTTEQAIFTDWVWPVVSAGGGDPAPLPFLGLLLAPGGGPSTSPIYAAFGSSSVAYSAPRASGSLSVRCSGAGVSRSGARGSGSVSARDFGASVSYSKPSASGGIQVRFVGSGDSLGAPSGNGAILATYAGSSTATAGPRATGAARIVDYGAGLAYGYLAVLSTTSPVYLRAGGYGAAFGGPRGLFSARAIDASGASMFGRPSASGGLAVRVFGVGVDRASPKAIGALSARDVAATYVIAAVDGLGSLRASDSSVSWLYGAIRDYVSPAVGLVRASATSRRPGIGAVGVSYGPGVAVRQPGLSVSVSEPDVSVAGSGPGVAASGRS